MANIKSQIKRNKQNEKASRAQQGRQDEPQDRRAQVPRGRRRRRQGHGRRRSASDAAQKLDKAASKGVIHKNQAANRKSAIAKTRRLALTSTR